jgi:hypothetical protein
MFLDNKKWSWSTTQTSKKGTLFHIKVEGVTKVLHQNNSAEAVCSVELYNEHFSESIECSKMPGEGWCSRKSKSPTWTELPSFYANRAFEAVGKTVVYSGSVGKLDVAWSSSNEWVLDSDMFILMDRSHMGFKPPLYVLRSIAEATRDLYVITQIRKYLELPDLGDVLELWEYCFERETAMSQPAPQTTNKTFEAEVFDYIVKHNKSPKAGYHELAIMYHPDRGGDHKSMVTINNTWLSIKKSLEGDGNGKS